MCKSVFRSVMFVHTSVKHVYNFSYDHTCKYILICGQKMTNWSFIFLLLLLFRHKQRSPSDLIEMRV